MEDYIKQAQDFLKNTNTKLDIKFKRFGAMKWDRDGQQRNVFDVTLTTERGSYNFEFGNSVVDSCAIVSAYDALLGNETVEIYAGFKAKKVGVCGHSFKMNKQQLENQDYDFVNKQAKALFEDAKKTFKRRAEALAKTNKYNQRYLWEIEGGYPQEDGFYLRVVRDAIKRTIKEMQETEAYAKDKQLNKYPIPTAYDILACLSVNYFEDVDDVVEVFGDMKPSQAQAIYEEDQALQRIFTDEQLQELSEVA